ncbi:MAG: glutamine--tRNA ligase/YqeY domain fusion protein [Spirochaetaceae bacterium]|nr:glutamine--tRNA ligase/YqeY domain fusion protein [Spirochaetaceae bacterium]
MENSEKAAGTGDFISEAIQEDLTSGRFSYVRTRFPPEPNGWLHIGHCKALSIDFGRARDFGGTTNLRMDDTNPAKEDISFVHAIERDLRWLGYQWDNEYFASDYYEYLYELAVKIIKKGNAYVDDLNDEEMREYRGTAVSDKNNITLTPPGKDSPYRTRAIEENLDLFRRMRAGEFPDGAKTLRAKIDMAHPNLVMRDPVMYRIKRATHYRAGDAWCIYPMYDFAHPLSDAKEGITHSLCSLEFEIHRPLYDWFISEAEVFPSRQIEFARLNLTRTVLSKRYLALMVNEQRVSGWDDPRMPTIAGLRRRGYTPEAIRVFMSRIGVAKTDSMIDIALLEYCLREDLNKHSLRVMVVQKPLKLIIENWGMGNGEWGMGNGEFHSENLHSHEMPEAISNQSSHHPSSIIHHPSSSPHPPSPIPHPLFDELEAVNNPEDFSAGTRKIHFGRELWIEEDDFAENPPPKYFRLFVGNSVRLRYGYIVTCTGFDKDAEGKVSAVRCTYDPATRGGNAPDNRKVKGTIHWVNAATAAPVEIRVFDYLFTVERPMETPPGGSFLDNFNADSLQVFNGYAEPCLAQAAAEQKYQFERLGYYVRDREDSADGQPVFNKTIGLRDTWAKIVQKKGFRV